MSSGLPNNYEGPFYLNGVLLTATAAQLNQMAITWGTGISTALQQNIGSSGAPLLFNGALGTPTSGDLAGVGSMGSASLTLTGVSAGSPVTAHYVKIGKLCFISLNMTGDATSNATTFTATGLPFTSASLGVGQFIPVTRVRDNGADLFGTGWAQVADAGTTITFFLSGNASGWTNTGGKMINFCGFYWTA